MCVIADAQRAVAFGGVMGGAETEVTTATRDVLIEAADFDPLSIRTTARKLSLHSDSSYRFERGLDPEGVDWASRRACELILELAGGELAAGVIDVGRKPPQREPIVLRLRATQTHPRHRRRADEVRANSDGAGQPAQLGASRRRGRGRSHSAHLAARSDARDRSGRGSRPHSRLRQDSRRRQRADGRRRTAPRPIEYWSQSPAGAQSPPVSTRR